MVYRFTSNIPITTDSYLVLPSCNDLVILGCVGNCVQVYLVEWNFSLVYRFTLNISITIDSYLLLPSYNEFTKVYLIELTLNSLFSYKTPINIDFCLIFLSYMHLKPKYTQLN